MRIQFFVEIYWKRDDNCFQMTKTKYINNNITINVRGHLFDKLLKELCTKQEIKPGKDTPKLN